MKESTFSNHSEAQPMSSILLHRASDTLIQKHVTLFVSQILLRAIAQCSTRLSHRLNVRPSVCLSVTLRYCVKTTQARITRSSLWAAPRTLVYRDKISCLWVKGFPLNEDVKKGYPLKRHYFAIIGSYSVKTVADRYRHACYHNKH